MHPQHFKTSNLNLSYFKKQRAEIRGVWKRQIKKKGLKVKNICKHVLKIHALNKKMTYTSELKH